MMDEASAISDSNEKSGSSSDISAKSKPRRWHQRFIIASILVVLLAAAIVLPPLININRYQRQITALMATAMGRPVRLSSVELRLLPLPGFVLHDLSVSEDPSFGSEPVLSAGTVVATVRIFSLWRGKLEISRVTVDEASLNLVRSSQGRWNLESLIMGASQPGSAGALATSAQSGKRHHPFPYLEATNSRVNLKNGAEKTPFSIIDTDLSLWQDNPGEWRVRLRGQPVRTDMEMSLADTGEVRLEATLRSAAQLREMPLKLQIEWRDAQLGQLSRLLSGSDAGWRGAVTADIDVQGTTEAAQTTARLQATGVGRQEFTPATPIDFDANCHFLYDHPHNAVHKLGCDTAIGDGHLHLVADFPGNAGMPQAKLEARQVPIQAALDLLRTVRRGFAPGIEAAGFVNGELVYQPVPATHSLRSSQHSKMHPLPPLTADLQGTLTVDGARLQGGKLKQPILLPKMTLVPAQLPYVGGSVDATGVSGQVSIPMPGHSAKLGPLTEVLNIRLGVTTHGYAITLGGNAALSELRDLSYAFGLPHSDAVDGFASGTADIDVAAEGPWIDSAMEQATDAAIDSRANLVSTALPASRTPHAASDGLNLLLNQAAKQTDQFSGTLQLHRAKWQAPYLTRPVELPQASVAISGESLDLTSDFVYGATVVSSDSISTNQAAPKPLIQGAMTLRLPFNCGSVPCKAQLQLHFGSLDAKAVQTALLSAPEEKSLFSPLMDRMRSGQKATYPALSIGVQADSLVLGSVTIRNPSAQLQVNESDIDIQHWEGEALGGASSGTGHFQLTDSKPEYTFDGKFTNLSPAAIGALYDTRWSGGSIAGDFKLQFSGTTEKDLTASTKGSANFRWQGGNLTFAPAQPLHFGLWTGALKIDGGEAQLAQNELHTARRIAAVSGTLTIGSPTRFALNSAAELTSRKAH